MCTKETQSKSEQKYTEPLSQEELIYQNKEGIWMKQPAGQEGMLIEPVAIYPQPKLSEDKE